MLIVWNWKTSHLSWPKTSLTACFIAWKLFLLTITLTSPGIGYDTSTELISNEILPTCESSSLLDPFFRRLCLKLVRWDAIYFTQIARRGYLFEQEWAFGWGFTRFLAISQKGSFPHFVTRDKIYAKKI